MVNSSHAPTIFNDNFIWIEFPLHYNANDIHFTVEMERCQCVGNYTGIDCSVLTSCGVECEEYEVCLPGTVDSLTECKGERLNGVICFEYG